MVLQPDLPSTNGLSIDPAGEERRFSWSAMPDGSGVVVALSGEFDLAVVDEASTPIQEAVSSASGTVVLDLSGLAFVDSTGLRFLIELKRNLDSAGERLLLRQVPAPVLRLFEAAGLTWWFDYAPGYGPRQLPCPLCSRTVVEGALRCSHCGGAL